MTNWELSQREAKKNKESCIRILSMSPKIRYVGKMNKFGRTLGGQLRKGVIPLFKPDEARNENFIEATRNQFRKAFEGAIGKTEYTLTKTKRLKSSRYQVMITFITSQLTKIQAKSSSQKLSM